ncbi:MAG: translocation/assembly module TamB domain-containing protein [Wenzhouxiangella sp.]
MKKILILVALSLLLLIGALASAWWWLSSTTSGAQWALNRASGVLPSLAWEALEGDLRRGLTVHGFSLDQDGTLISIDRIELAARVQLPPAARVDVHWLRAFNSEIQLAESLAPEEEREPFALPDIASPIEIRIHELMIQNLAVLGAGEGAEPLRFERIALTGRYFDTLDIDTLTLAMPDLNAEADGRLALSAPFASELRLAAEYQIQPDLVQAMHARIDGTLNALRIDLATSGPAILQGEIRLKEVLNDPRLELDLTGRLGDWPGLELAIEALSIEGRGGLDAWDVVLAGQASGPDIPSNQWRFDLSGDLESVLIRSGQIEVLDGRVDLSGRAALNPEPQLDLSVALAALDLTVLYPDWPQQARLDGGFQLDATPERLVIEDLTLSAPPTALRLDGQGRWTAETDALSAAISWSEFSWPPVLDDSEPLLYSRSGALRLSGQLSDWQAELEAVLRLSGQPEARIEAGAGGSESQADIRQLRLDVGDAGTLQAEGTVAWAPDWAGNLDLKLEQFDTGAWVEALPGRLDLDLNLLVNSLDDIRLDLRQLEGVLRNQPVSGQGQLQLSTEAAAGGALALNFGDNRVELDSADGRRWRLDLVASALQQLAPETGGQLRAQGDIDLDRGQLRLDAILSDSGWEAISVRRGEINTTVSWQADRIGGELQLRLNDLDLSPWERVDTVELNIDGDCLAHTAALSIAGQRGTVDLQAAGALDACMVQGISAWTGAINRLFIGDTPAGNWELNQPLALELSAERVVASQGCLVEASERVGRLCLRELEVADSGRIEIGIEQVPMDLLLVPLDPIFNLTTPLSGELSAGWSAAQGLERVAGFLVLDSGALKPLGEDDSLLDIESVRLDLIPETDHLRLVLDARLEGDSQLTGEAQLIDLNDPSSATIDALARLNLPDVGVFNRLVAELDQLGGQLSGEMAVRGALLGPSLDGQLSLAQGLIVYAPLGVRIEDINLALDGTETRASLSGSMRGGDGTMRLDGEMLLVDDQWQLDARVDGERFRFADVNWLRLTASPAVSLARAGDGIITLDGDIHINQLRAGMPPGAEQRVNASPDVRVRGEVAEEDASSELADRLQGRLGVHLGEDARTSAIGMQARLAGGLELLWDRETIEPRARGVIRIPEGSFRAYGQNLQIADGEVVFTGHAIDNPSLNVAATREIFGDPQVERAGVLIRGNAQDPRITLFTDPPTSEEKALAYVVTGANFDHASGQAAINVGFYLLPRLFVSYGIGLFEAGDVLSARFELSRRWGVRVVSGERDTGVDLSFAIDR